MEGRIAGPWVEEFNRVWVETAPRLANRKLVLDLRDVTYADVRGTQVLREICSQTHAEIIAETVWTQSLADQITQVQKQQSQER